MFYLLMGTSDLSDLNKHSWVLQLRNEEFCPSLSVCQEEWHLIRQEGPIHFLKSLQVERDKRETVFQQAAQRKKLKYVSAQTKHFWQLPSR